MGEVLPKNWVETTLKITTSIIRGVTYKKEDSLVAPKKDSVYILRGRNIQNGNIVINNDDNVYVSSSIIKEEQFVRANDVVIVGSTGSKKVIGKAGTICGDNNNMSFGAFLMLLRTNSINKRYHSYFFQTHYYRKIISSVAGGININNIKKEHIEDILIPLPPLTEQERIANKLDILFAQIDNVRRSTYRIPQLLKNLRQQILTHAVTGKLTAEWRNGSDTSSWEMKQLKDIAIPKSGYAFKSSEFTDSGIQVIRMGNLYGNKLSLERSPVFVDASYDSNIVNKYKLNNNDILLTLTGTKYKRDYGYAIKINTDTPLLLNQRILSLTPQIDPDFLMYLLREESFRDCFFSFETGGVNQGNVGVQNVMKISMLIPPQKEQEAIVEKVTALFEQLDNIEERYERLTKKLKDLPQSLLHKAFKGELVPQLSTDGSAADLLREIETLNKTITKRKK